MFLSSWSLQFVRKFGGPLEIIVTSLVNEFSKNLLVEPR